MVYLDTNVVLRYLLDDHPELSERARQIIDESEELFIWDSVCAEIVYVLLKVYNVEREVIKQTISNLSDKSNIFVSNKLVIIKSLEIFANQNLDFIDCLLCAYNHIDNVKIETFDNKLEKLLKWNQQKNMNRC